MRHAGSFMPIGWRNKATSAVNFFVQSLRLTGSTLSRGFKEMITSAYFCNILVLSSRKKMRSVLSEEVREHLRKLFELIDPSWLAFMTTLGCPFRPYFFYNETDLERSHDKLPFTEPIGSRGGVITFESAFRAEKAWDTGLMHELGFLCQLELGECAYGAATCPVYPFICEWKTGSRKATGAQVLAALKPRNFRSRYIPTLETTRIAFPGYNPGGENDEIHNDFSEQFIFPKGDEDSEEEVTEFSGAHGLLKRSVVDGQLWYVLLHTPPEQVEESWFSSSVILFAVGRSKNGNRLIGVVTHQVCHNLCD